MTTMKRLTGKAMLAKVRELGGCTKTELCQGCGYVMIKPDGKERMLFNEFYEELLKAKGLSIPKD